MSLKKELTTIDFIVFFLGIGISLAIGIYYAYKERNKMTPYRYHRGGGKLKALPVALSMLVTFESSIFFLGYPAEVYVHGFEFWLYNVAVVIGYSSLLWLSVPIFYRLQVTSVFEYLQMRHDSLAIRQMTMAFSLLYMTVYAGIVIYGAAIAVESVTEIPSFGSVVGFTTVAVIYTALGGLKAVVATDVIQGVIMIGSIFALLIYGTLQVGGIEQVIALNEPTGRMKMVDFDTNPLVRHTFWTMLFGGIIRCLPISIRQAAVQRLNSTINISEARKVVFISLVGFFVLHFLVKFEGLVAFAYFSKKGCDPLASGQISSPNQIISYTFLDMFQNAPGVAGIFLAALCSASLSTISSLLSSASAVVVEDIVKPRWPSSSNRKLVYISKLVVVLCGVVCAAIATLVGKAKGPMGEIAGSVLGALDGPLTAIFAMSIFVRFSTRKGIVASAVVGMATALWLSLGYNFSSGRKVTPWLPLGPTNSCVSIDDNDIVGWTNLNATKINNSEAQPGTEISRSSESPKLIEGVDIVYSISYMYFSAIVLIVSMIVGLIVSKMTSPRSDTTEVPEYLMLSFNRCRRGRSETKACDEEIVFRSRGRKLSDDKAGISPPREDSV